jgi:hypothetical protein
VTNGKAPPGLLSKVSLGKAPPAIGKVSVSTDNCESSLIAQNKPPQTSGPLKIPRPRTPMIRHDDPGKETRITRPSPDTAVQRQRKAAAPATARTQDTGNESPSPKREQSHNSVCREPKPTQQGSHREDKRPPLHLPPTDTWTNFQLRFNKHEKTGLSKMTAQAAGFHGAQNATHTPAEVTSDTPASAPSAQQAGKPKEYVSNGIPLFYCWSQGLSKNLEHTGSTCLSPKEGHCSHATIENRLGGVNKINFGRSGQARRNPNSLGTRGASRHSSA